MANLLLEVETEEFVEARVVHVGDRAIRFERFVEMANRRDLELVSGIIVEKPMVQLDHERCSRWLYQFLDQYVEERGLGEMLSSRIMVKTDDFGGRMPDLLFVRQERLDIIQQKAVYGAPDLVIEIVSANDRPSDLRSLEADYSRLGVGELMFVDLRKQEIRLLRRRKEAYAETVITAGEVMLEMIPEMKLQAEWILQERRPPVRTLLNLQFTTT
jgi:Uma2 family endonuclease